MSSNEEVNITLSEKDFKSDVEAAMLMLSDGLSWRLTSDPEDTGEPLVMSSPEEIAEFLTLYLFHPESRDTDLLGSEDPAASVAPA